MLVNISMKFHEDILNYFSFLVDKILLKKWLFIKFIRMNLKSTNPRVTVCSACRPVLINISMKVHEDILNGFQVIDRI